MILPQAVYNHSMIYLRFLVEDLPDPESLKRGFACTTSGSPPVLSPSTRFLTGQADSLRIFNTLIRLKLLVSVDPTRLVPGTTLESQMEQNMEN